jgi:hypothetical protein
MYHSTIGFLTPQSTGIPEYTIGGVQSGTLPIGIYTVESDIVVLEGDELVLTAGSVFEMEDNVMWEVQGVLTAIGTSGSHITFSKVSAATQWHGLRFCKEVSVGTGTATVDTGTNVVSVSGFSKTTNFPTRFTTTGVLPAPLEVGARYYFKADGTISGSLEGPSIDITDVGSGTHTIYNLDPTTSTGLQSSDYALTQTLQYCDFLNAKKTNLPSQYNSPPAYRHWYRGGGLCAFQIEDPDFDYLTFTDCAAYERGGGCYYEGLTSTSVATTFTNWEFTNCASDDTVTEPGGSFAQSHGQQGTTLTNFTFNNSISDSVHNYVGTGLVFDSGTDEMTVYNAGYSLRNGLSVSNFLSDGSIPAGLSGGTNYYMINVSNDDPSSGYSTYQMSLSPGGSAVDLTSVGSGTITCDLSIDYYIFDTTPSISGFAYT